MKASAVLLQGQPADLTDPGTVAVVILIVFVIVALALKGMRPPPPQ